jgi:hypothetical protein
MHTIAAEFREILHQYLKLTEVLERVFHVEASQDPQALVRSILENQDCLKQIVQVNDKAQELSGLLERSCVELHPADREEIQFYANAVKTHSYRIRELCRLQEQRIQSRRDQLAHELIEIENGARYLKILKPAPTNYPKFIDSNY